MTAKTSKTLYGTVTVTVGDDTYTLTPTLGAVRAIEAQLGGLMGAVDATRQHSVTACACVIAAGAGLSPQQAAELPEKIWQAGILSVGIQLVPYVAALLNPKGDDAVGNAPKVSAQ